MSNARPAAASEPSATCFVTRSSPSALVSTTLRYVTSWVAAAVRVSVRKPVKSSSAVGLTVVPVPLPTVYCTCRYCPVSRSGMVSSTR